MQYEIFQNSITCLSFNISKNLYLNLLILLILTFTNLTPNKIQKYKHCKNMKK